MMSAHVGRLLSLLVGGAALLTLTACERPPMEVKQAGYRGTGMMQVTNPRLQQGKIDANQVPTKLRQRIVPEAPFAREVYQNVQVLGDLGVVEFGRTMVAITQWVSPKESCAYCHVEGNFADDSKYTKVVARRMLQMTQHLNGNWKTHVAETGVTCYTCHRGQPVPTNIWFSTPSVDRMVGAKQGQNTPFGAVKMASLPVDPYTPYLLQPEQIRVVSKEPLPSDNHTSIKKAEQTYSLMMSMSNALGVNCTYCHNSRSFISWEGGPPARVTAYYGIRMVRDLNNHYLVPLTSVFPPHRLGAQGDAPKINCATCHQGVYKPLYGGAMAQDYPALTLLPRDPTAAPAPALTAPEPASGPAATMNSKPAG